MVRGVDEELMVCVYAVDSLLIGINDVDVRAVCLSHISI